MMRVLLVDNMTPSDPGQVLKALREAGAELDLRKPYAGDPLPSDSDDHDAMVVFGGEQSAIDDAVHPYLPTLAGLMRRFSDAGKSVLGICLGSQLLARAHGGDNLLGGSREFGWHEITLTHEGRGDPVLSAAGDAFDSFQWHSDSFTLPAGAVHLAMNAAVANQAFCIGRAAYGMQFHFEANRKVVVDWNVAFADQIDRIEPDWLTSYPEHEARHAAGADAAGLALARAWVATIRTEAVAEHAEAAT